MIFNTNFQKFLFLLGWSVANLRKFEEVVLRTRPLCLTKIIKADGAINRSNILEAFNQYTAKKLEYSDNPRFAKTLDLLEKYSHYFTLYASGNLHDMLNSMTNADIGYYFALGHSSSERDPIEILENDYISLAEAAEIWQLSDGSVLRHAILDGRFEPHEYRKSGKVTLIRKSAMIRLYGDPPTAD